VVELTRSVRRVSGFVQTPKALPIVILQIDQCWATSRYLWASDTAQEGGASPV